MSDQPGQAGLSVSVVIPVLNAEPYFPELLDALLAQEPVPPLEIILVDSMSTDRTRDIASTYEQVTIIPIENFSHGRARNVGARAARGEIIALMTQDALPRDNTWLARLVEPFADEKVCGVCSRQVPRPDASPMEQYFLHTHFPPGEPVRRAKQEGKPLTLEDVFFSNVAAAVRRELLLQLPFDETLIMSEDQQMSRDMLEAGYAVVYQPESVVIHSHNYTLPVVFRRYFDSVYSLTVIFPRHDMGTSASMGLSYLWKEVVYMFRHHPTKIFHYLLYTMMKTLGTVAGHFADRMPNWMLKRLSLHSYHWREQVAGHQDA
jgi:rhamnosyltransferase